MAAMALDSPGLYPESPGAQDDDVVYPCKGCGEILEEGKAFELAGNRWHIDCFRCNTCGTLLDSDANLLLLGDGSLICNNCTYSCNACGNKIEDLAILTGDQAFCASCFRCRNCKRKIENLRYARTSQGIFCMSCHESLMARRRKKAKATPRQAAGGANGEKVDKALPSLPPGAATPAAFSPEAETPPAEVYQEPQIARSPRHSLLKSRQEQPLNDIRRDVSPISDEARRADGPLLPASTYNKSSARRSNVEEDSDDGDERGFLPMAFDPTPVSAPPQAVPRKQVPQSQELSPPENRPPRDYFSTARPSAKASSQRETLREEQQRPDSSRSVSTERERGPERTPHEPKSSPHILYQDKARQQKKRSPSGQTTPQSASTTTSPINSADRDGKQQRPWPQQLDTSSYTLSQSEGFKLQEAPKTRKPSRGSPKIETKSPVSPIQSKTRDADKAASNSPVSLDSPGSGVNPFDDPKRNKDGAFSNLAAPAPIPPRHADRPVRGDSLAASALKSSKPATPEPTNPTTLLPPSNAQFAPSHTRDTSATSIPTSFVDAASTISRDNSRIGSPAIRSSFDQIPLRASSRPSAPSKSVANGDFIAPRAPPPPPPVEYRHHKNSESISTLQSADDRSDGQLSPGIRSAGLPKQSTDGAFSMEDEMARIMHGDKRESENTNSSVLRRVSNAVKHGRSFSDRPVDKSSNSPHSRSIEISSPMNTNASPRISSPASQDPLDQLRSHNRRQARQIAEQQAEIDAMRDQINNSAYIKAATSELDEKRNTISVLDTQREVVVAELESMTAHLKKAKDSNQPLDYSTLKSDILKDFGDALQRLKDQLTNQIEDLMHRRHELTDEIGTLIQMKDKGFQEFESLQGRNAELIDMNNQLVHNIQETYKANRVPNGTSAINGLGIYHQSIADKPQPAPESNVRNLNLVNTDSSMPDLLQETAAEPATVLTAPQVVNIRKGQPKKFNWRKGGEKMAKNITKGVKGAFVGESGGVRGKEIGAPYTEIGVPYNATLQQAMPGSDVSSLDSKQKISAPSNGGPGFGFFGQKGGKGGQLGNVRNSSNGNLAAVAGADPSILFGSELELRCAHENRVIPSIVSRCVDEVESRGMDVEGIYRKSGGNTQVKAVQAAFEKDGNYDISDPDLDIHAVTSALKQYFRKLPTPLITFDVYEIFLEAGQTQDKEKQAYNLRMAVAELPEHHRNCLEYLVQHLARVIAHERENLMTPLNLAVVFAPTIMRPLSIEREMSDMQAQRTAVQALLEGHRKVFPEE
ncbi:RhoGAP-domain-containing protein [Teratosphaeria nubilosa]|uniref:RhoGAP-domain-containing protein n=1 Tax=Teratosphaeria nubilosa TaxID=161662 RepID=A0A6G1LHS6_9PEZI|nr:RhoGAP-domain-containing protein [Teratosphaeria nubilosa]